jgi:regulator of protease activity HflC (stomatin/prohibitin superfamily)
MNIVTLLAGVVALLWVLVIGAVVLVVIRSTRGQRMGNAGLIIGVPIVLALVLTAFNAGLVFIQPDERGVVVSAVAQKGYRELALMPGLHWIIPFAENVITYSISKQTYTMSSATGEGPVKGDDSVPARTSDGQLVNIDASVIYSINPDQVVNVHINWQNRYTDDLVRAQARGIIRDTVSQYNVEEAVTTKRLALTATIHDTMMKKLSDNGLILVDFVLRNISFSPEYAASVEQKQIAEQQAQQAKFVVEQKKQEAEQARQVAQGRADAVVIQAQGDAKARVVNAQAEAQALNLIAVALKDQPDLLIYQYISKLSPNIQAMLLPSNSPFIFPLPQLTPPPSTSQNQPAATPQPTPVPTQAPSPTVAPTLTPTPTPKP